MRLLLISAILFTVLTVRGQVYVQVKNVNNKATFQATAEFSNTPAAAIQEAAIAWVEETFLSQDVITGNTPGSITLRYPQDYTDGTWSGQYEHTLQISITDGKADFTISDTKMGLIRSDGTWKEHLGKMKALYEQAANDLFWSFEKSIKASSGQQ